MESCKFQIRSAVMTDAERILEIYSPYIFQAATSFEEVPPGIDKMKARISNALEKHSWIVAMDSSANVIGYAYGSRHRDRIAYRWACEVAIYVDKKFQRQGIGNALYRELLQQLRSRGYYRAYAGITLPNEASIALHERFGFMRIGTYHSVGFKLGKWHDVGWWELALRESKEKPSEPG